MSVDLFHDPVIRTGQGANKKRRMRLWWRFADHSTIDYQEV